MRVVSVSGLTFDHIIAHSEEWGRFFFFALYPHRRNTKLSINMVHLPGKRVNLPSSLTAHII